MDVPARDARSGDAGGSQVPDTREGAASAAGRSTVTTAVATTASTTTPTPTPTPPTPPTAPATPTPPATPPPATPPPATPPPAAPAPGSLPRTDSPERTATRAPGAGSTGDGSTGDGPGGDGPGPLAPLDPPAKGRPAPVTSLTGAWRVLVVAGVVVTVAAGIVLRFDAKSALWLDEALTVNIARLPVHLLPGALRRDGAPPLFYFLLHFWMGLFGTSDLATRSLSGVLSVATLPVAYVAARNYGGRVVGWVTFVLLASAPFAIAYGTEARMYALVMFLTACGFVSIERALRRPRPGNLIATGVVTGALLYSHYWSLYLIPVVALWLLYQGFRRQRPGDAPHLRSNSRWTFLSVAVGCLTFVPWLPTFFFQEAHTGTPWSKPPSFSAAVSAVVGFASNQYSNAPSSSSAAHLLALCYFGIGALGLLGLGLDRWHIELDIRTRPHARAVAVVVLGTLMVAVLGAQVTASAFSNRYAAVVFVPLLVLIALGTVTMLDVRVRTVVVAVAVVAGLGAGAQNISTQRTQAQQIATSLAAHARAGDVVAFCPDQLGPSVSRLVPPGRYRMITYPRATGAQFVNWIDYRRAIDASSPTAFAQMLKDVARQGGHQIFLVWDTGYQGFGTRCQQLVAGLLQGPGSGAHDWVVLGTTQYEPMQLTQFSAGT